MSNAQHTPRDGTFDVLATQRREVFVNGIHAVSIPAQAFDFLRDGFGSPVKLSPFGTFPDIVKANEQ